MMNEMQDCRTVKSPPPRPEGTGFGRALGLNTPMMGLPSGFVPIPTNFMSSLNSEIAPDAIIKSVSRGYSGGLRFVSSQQETEESQADGIDSEAKKDSVKAFFRLQKKLSSLDREVRKIVNELVELDPTGKLLSACDLHARFTQVVLLFCENTASIFPSKFPRLSVEAYMKEKEHIWEASLTKRKWSEQVALTQDGFKNMERRSPNSLPRHLLTFAKDIELFLKNLNELSEEPSINVPIKAFETDLRYWAAYLLTYYDGQLDNHAVQWYLHGIGSDVAKHVDNITKSLRDYAKNGIPRLRTEQKQAEAEKRQSEQAMMNQQLTTVATLFSAITATTLQFTFSVHDHPLANAVNSFWLCSLVFSIASVVNTLLGLMWRQTTSKSSRDVPQWLWFWIQWSPLPFLFASVVTFSVGLALFAYSSGQSPVTASLTTFFTALSSFGLVSLCIWFAIDRWFPTQWKSFLEFAERTLPRKSLKSRSNDQVKAESKAYSHSDRKSSKSSVVTDIDDALSIAVPLHEKSPSQFVDVIDLSSTPSSGSSTSVIEISIEPPSRPVSLGSVKSANSINMLDGRMLRTKRRVAEALRNFLQWRKEEERRAMESLKEPFRGLQLVRSIQHHNGLVRHLQFSPTGEYLAACSWDRICAIFSTRDFSRPHLKLPHPGGFASQVAWSPSGDLLLTKMVRSVRVWNTFTGDCENTIDRQQRVHSVAWFPGGQVQLIHLSAIPEFLCVEGNEDDSALTKLTTSGKVLKTYRFNMFVIHDVAITLDGERMLCVATFRSSAHEVKPSSQREEKAFIIFNFTLGKVENRFPLVHEARNITLSKDGSMALVSFENAAPQLWRLKFDTFKPDDPIIEIEAYTQDMLTSGLSPIHLEMMQQRMNDKLRPRQSSYDLKSSGRARLTNVQMFAPAGEVEFVGPCYFGGFDDQYILRADKDGDVHIWDQKASKLLHTIEAADSNDSLTCIAWNSALLHPMIALGSHDGSLRIYSVPSSQFPLKLERKSRRISLPLRSRAVPSLHV